MRRRAADDSRLPRASASRDACCVAGDTPADDDDDDDDDDTVVVSAEDGNEDEEADAGDGGGDGAEPTASGMRRSSSHSASALQRRDSGVLRGLTNVSMEWNTAARALVSVSAGDSDSAKLVSTATYWSPKQEHTHHQTDRETKRRGSDEDRPHYQTDKGDEEKSQ